VQIRTLCGSDKEVKIYPEDHQGLFTSNSKYKIMSHRIQKYKLIISENSTDLEQSINEHFKKGFELYGDPGIKASSDGTSKFFQAMVLRGDF
tara:strand:- start:60 stop:335 length:276 start_codon:yes stop_codon:yes gene_type:complete